MRLPTFLVVGAAKSGTTALHRYLGQHPEIYTTMKEPSFFAFEGQHVDFAGPGDRDGLAKSVVTRLDDYAALFEPASEPARGEASVVYLYDPGAAARIRHYVPDVKLIAVLRNPVDRAHSSFRHLRRDGREPIEDFSLALQQEEARIGLHWEHQWHYTRLGFYHEQLQRYFDLFPAEQIAVHTYDDFQDDPLGVLQGLFRFLDLDDGFVPDMSTRYNRSGATRFATLRRVLARQSGVKRGMRPFVPQGMWDAAGGRIRRWNTRADESVMTADTRRGLVELYRDDIRRLESLLQRDLSAWLRVE